MKKILCVLDMHADFIKKNTSKEVSKDIKEVFSMKEIVGWS